MNPVDVDADIDALVLGADPGLPPPAVPRADVVLVTGPSLAGTTAVVAALRRRLPGCRFVESAELGTAAPAAVVFVVSAAAPLTASDRALLDTAAADTDAVIGVVAKIDVHRTWREVLDENRRLLAAHRARYARLRWVGAAAAPDLAAVAVDDLVDAVRQTLADDSLPRRNRFRAWENHLNGLALGYEREVSVARLAALRDQRAATVRQARRDKTERAVALRSRVQRARVQLSHLARGRCAAVRTELQEGAHACTRRGFGAFTAHVRRRVDELTAEVDEVITRDLRDVAADLGLPAPAPPPGPPAPVAVTAAPLRPRRAESRLMTLLGAGFGLGVALTLGRLFADLSPRWTVAGVAACAVMGVGLTLWVVSTRGLLHDRAVLDRWVGEVFAGLRGALEERVATRLLAAESALGLAAAERDADAASQVDRTLAGIDREIRQHAAVRAAALADRAARMPLLTRALSAVRTELEAVYLNRSCE